MAFGGALGGFVLSDSTSRGDITAVELTVTKHDVMIKNITGDIKEIKDSVDNTHSTQSLMKQSLDRIEARLQYE